MLNAFLAGVVVGAILFWKISRWWRKSSIKKASDAVGTATKGPASAARGLFAKAKDLYDKATKPNDKEKKP